LYFPFFTPLKNNPIVISGKNVVFRIIYPFQYIFYKGVVSVSNFTGNVIKLRSAQKENEKLREEVLIERSILNTFENLIRENETLRTQLNYSRKTSRFALIPAEVVARSPSSFFNEVIIDKGKKDGVFIGKAVISESGLVGRITEVYPSSSKVRLLIDENSSVSVVIKRTNEIGVVSGNSYYLPKLKYISSTSDVRDGDMVITSGISDYFPKGIPVGYIKILPKKELELFYNIDLIPVVDFSKLRFVFVVR